MERFDQMAHLIWQSSGYKFSRCHSSKNEYETEYSAYYVCCQDSAPVLAGSPDTRASKPPPRYACQSLLSFKLSLDADMLNIALRHKHHKAFPRRAPKSMPKPKANKVQKAKKAKKATTGRSSQIPPWAAKYFSWESLNEDESDSDDDDYNPDLIKARMEAQTAAARTADKLDAFMVNPSSFLNEAGKPLS